MNINNERIKRTYRMIYLVLCISGIILQFANASIVGGNSVKMLFAYYTMETNILCFLYFGYLTVVCPNKENGVIKGAVVMSILLTGLGYHLLLADGMGSMEGASTPFFNYSNLMVHTVTPAMALIDYLLFTPKGNYKWYYPLYWVIIPALYCIFVFVRPLFSSTQFMGFSGLSDYPYPFVDPVAMGGVWKVVLSVVVLFVTYLVLSYIYYGIDKLLGLGNKNKY